MSRTLHLIHSGNRWFRCLKKHKRINHKEIKERSCHCHSHKWMGVCERDVNEVIDLQSNTVDGIAYCISDGLLYLVWWAVWLFFLVNSYASDSKHHTYINVHTHSCHTRFVSLSFWTLVSVQFGNYLILFFIHHRRERASTHQAPCKTSPILTLYSYRHSLNNSLTKKNAKTKTN